MTKPGAASKSPTQGSIPTGSVAEVLADRTARARKHASNCVLLAVVTSPELSADLIDQAIEYVRDADESAPALPGVAASIAMLGARVADAPGH